MFRRYSISFSILFAFLLVQGHNFVPHHHHEEKSHHATSHQHEHDNDGDHDNNEDADPPFNANHLADFGKVLVKWEDLNELLVKSLMFPVLTQLAELEHSSGSPPVILPPVNIRLQISLLSYSVPLRAPPAPVFVA